MEEKYLVSGNWDGRVIEVVVSAHSDKQAKFKAGLNEGIRGKELGEFTKSQAIKVRRTK